MAVVLSFYGYQEPVVNLLQKISHSTRAYIWNADGLPGFLARESDLVFMVLEDAMATGQL